jgi:hypothetical protein
LSILSLLCYIYNKMKLEALVLSLPTRNSTIRMRVWRALKETGCGVLRDGVYVLPADSAGGPVLTRLESEIKAADGAAMTVELTLKGPEQLARGRALFDRSVDYGVLVQKVNATKASLARLGARKARTATERLQRALDRLAQIDFYPGEAKAQAADALAKLKRAYQEVHASGEPHPSNRPLRQLDRARYRKRVWATRKNLWVDRLASAWLIRRFIDPEARFVWLERPRDQPAKAIGFDFDGAQFTHVGNRVTFEVLLASFGLEGDPALAALGAAVHFLDAGGIPVPDAKGLETMLRGAKEKARNDDALLAEAMRLLDLFYSGHGKGA